MKYALLLLFIPNLIFGQFEKSFTNTEEYLLSNKIQEALSSESYSYCTGLTKKLIAITDEPDRILLQDCIECSIKSKNQIQTEVLLQLAQKQAYKLSEKFGETVLESSPALFEKYNSAFDKEEIKASNFELANQLAQMFIDDQVCRSVSFDPIIQWAERLGYTVTENHELTCQQADSINTIKLDTILKMYPNISVNEVGNFGMYAFTAVIQHSGNNQKYQNQMEQWKNNGDIQKRTYGTYLDRLNTQIGKPQVYGTQFSCQEYAKMENIDKINERRMELGMMSIERYVKHFGKIWKYYIEDCIQDYQP